MQAADLLKAQVKKALQEVLLTHVVKEHLLRANFQINLSTKNAPPVPEMKVVKKDPEEVRLPEAHHVLKEEVKDLLIKEKQVEEMSAGAVGLLMPMPNHEEVFLKVLNEKMMNVQDVHQDLMVNAPLSVNAVMHQRNPSEVSLIIPLRADATSIKMKNPKEGAVMQEANAMMMKDLHAEILLMMNLRKDPTILLPADVMLKVMNAL